MAAIFLLFSTPVVPLAALFSWASEPSTKVLLATNPGHLLLTSWQRGLDWGLFMAVFGATAITLVVFVPGWMIYCGIRGLVDGKTELRGLFLIVAALLLVAFYALLFSVRAT